VTEPDAVMARIGEGIALREHGERGAGFVRPVMGRNRRRERRPLHRCALEHSLANVQDDVHEELPGT
jgi:hypothetical protein